MNKETVESNLFTFEYGKDVEKSKNYVKITAMSEIMNTKNEPLTKI